MAQGEITVIAYFPREGASEDKDAATYWDRIKPTLMPAGEYFATVEPREAWQQRHEERALSELYGVPVKVKVTAGAA